MEKRYFVEPISMYYVAVPLPDGLNYGQFGNKVITWLEENCDSVWATKWEFDSSNNLVLSVYFDSDSKIEDMALFKLTWG